MFGLGNVVQYRGLWVDKKLDISEVYPQAMHPVALEREFESTFTDGKLMVKITTQRQAFVKKESVEIDVEIENEQGDAAIDAIEGRLLLEGKFYSISFLEEEVLLKGLRERTSLLVGEGKKGKCSLKIPFNFLDCDMDNNLMPAAPGIIPQNEYVIQQPSYQVELRIIRKGFQNENFEMKIPLNVGSINSAMQINNNDKNPYIPHETILYKENRFEQVSRDDHQMSVAGEIGPQANKCEQVQV